MSNIRLQRISPDDTQACEDAVQVIKEGFFPDESCCVGVDLASSPAAVEQLSLLVRVALRDGASVGLYSGDQMAAVCVNKVQVPPPPGEQSFFEQFRDEHTSDPRAKFLMDFMLKIDARADLFGALGEGRERLLELMFLGVVPAHRGRGYATQVVRESVAVAKDLGVFGVSAIFTSDYSAAVGRSLGFKEMAVQEHSEFMFEGAPITQRLASHQQRSRLVLLRLPAC